MPGGSPFYQYGSGSGNASPHGHLPSAFSRSAICIQTGQRAQVVNRPDRIIWLQVRALPGAKHASAMAYKRIAIPKKRAFAKRILIPSSLFGFNIVQLRAEKRD